jgi:phytoene desaturase
MHDSVIADQHPFISILQTVITNMQQKKVIIIGSGVAGMAAATRLAVQGFDVTVLEKNDYPGGKLSFFEKDGYRFDAGPSLFTQPVNVEELFELAGEPMEEYFKYKPVDIACRYFYENGKVVNAYTDKVAFSEEMTEQLGESAQAVTRYLKDAEKLYENTATVFLNHSLHKRSTWLHKRVIGAFKAVKFSYLFKTLDQHNSKRFTSPEAVQLFNRYATYNGSNPYKAPGMLSLIPHLEQNQGTFYPMGGMISITNALYRLAQAKSVRFQFNTTVDKIIHHEGRVRGVVMNGENAAADIVISNADAYFTYKNLLGNPFVAKKILKQERSSSALIFYWGIKKSFNQLQLHNIFFSSNYSKEFNSLFVTKTLYHDPTVYINITSKAEPSQAPAGKENWFVMINAPANNGQNWQELQAQAKLHILEKLSRILQCDIAPLIETEETLDPLLIEERTGSYMGSLYGTSSNSKLAAFLRHPNFTSQVKGLYFCGGSVHPGGGIPLCLKSAKIVSELIQKNKKHYQH